MHKPKIVAIIQARMASTRLPGKVLLPLAGKPCLWWMIKRTSLAKLVDEIVVATTDDNSNDPIEDFYNYANKEFNNLSLFRYSGNENDVIGRVLKCAQQRRGDIICDISSDCPLVDPRHIDKLILILFKQKYDYISNDIINRSWPDGSDLQIYTTKSLEKCIKLFNPIKHCGWNIAQHPEEFEIYHWKAPKEMHFPHWGLTLDEISDYELLSIIFSKFGKDSFFSLESVIQYLKDNPKLLEINQKVKRKNPEIQK